MHFANSGEGALAQLTEGIEPTLIVILSDINMPGMDGLTLLSEIKQRFPDLPVVMVTAYGDDERRRTASELGAFEFLTKPVDFDYLKAQLRQLSTAADGELPVLCMVSMQSVTQSTCCPIDTGIFDSTDGLCGPVMVNRLGKPATEMPR
jgi:CheY-like chemotaxis protein